MGKVAFVFSGQGDQYPGMGKALYEVYPAARDVFDMCDAIRPATSAQCFEGSEAALQETATTQPCLYAMELAAAAVLTEKGIAPDAVAGFSLGEVTAAAFSGAFSRETGFRLVCRRGELMQQEAERFDTAMAAVVKLSEAQVRELCEKHGDIYPVNFNCPGQITVSGLAERMPEFSAEVKAAGGRALPLKVKGAFHSPYMRRAADAFAETMRAAEIRTPEITLYSNMTALPYPDDVAAALAQQIVSPVLWERLIRNMIDSGVDTFIEIGPGKTLTNMIRKISGEVAAKTYEELLEEAQTC